jgi:uncharacterized protein YegJ (DUF2314 family)
MRKTLFVLSLICIFLTACSAMNQFQPAENNSMQSISTGEDANSEIIPGDDLEMRTAIHLAQATLPSFTEFFKHPKPSQVYFSILVKIAVYDEDEVTEELFWVDELSYADNRFEGTVVNDAEYADLRAGDPIIVQPQEIMDWMIIEDGRLIGGFTLIVDHNRMSDSEREQFDADLWFTIPEEPELPAPDTIEM